MLIGIGDLARLGQVSTRTLRHYQELGLLQPAEVDPGSGYRRYAVRQLADLHRILALRDLGLGLDRIQALLAEGVPVEELRGMLRLRREELAATIADEQERLRRVEAHLDALERGGTSMDVDVVVKRSEGLRMAGVIAKAPGYGYDNINPVFEAHLRPLTEALLAQGLRFGPCVAWYEEAPDDEVVVHLGWEVGDQAVDEVDEVVVQELPGTEVASTIIQGSMTVVMDVFEGLVRWVEANGYGLADAPSRELYHELQVDVSCQVTELQLPVFRL